jgi:hypothetical protein
MIMSAQMIKTAWRDVQTGHETQKPKKHWLTWRRFPPWLELAILAAGYAAPSFARLALPAAGRAAFAHAAELYHAEQQVHLNVEPYLNHLISAHAVLALVITLVAIRVTRKDLAGVDLMAAPVD